MKNVFDRSMAVLALIILSPLFGLVAALVKLTSPGPVPTGKSGSV